MTSSHCCRFRTPGWTKRCTPFGLHPIQLARASQGRLRRRWWAPRRRRRSSAHRRMGGHGARCHKKPGSHLRNRGGNGAGRGTDTGAQGAVQVGDGLDTAVVMVSRGYFHGLHGCAMGRRRCGPDKRRSDGHAQKKRKPHQHVAGDQVGVAQGLHRSIIGNCRCSRNTA